MSRSTAQRSGFEDRLSRIKQGGANTMGEVHIGPPPSEERARKGKSDNVVRMKKRKQTKIAAGEGSTVILAPVAFLLGGMSMFTGQAADYQLFHDGGLINLAAPEILAPFMQFAPFAFGGFLALMFAWTFRLTSALRFIALLGGFGAVFYYQADLIQSMPGMYANFFSVEFVEAALSNA